MGLWALAGSHCMDYLTDGVVERWFVDSIPGGAKLARQLVGAGLWYEHADGWVFHDWDGYQPTRESVLAERAATKERVKKHRSNGARNGVTPPVSNGVGTTPPSPSPDLTQTSTRQSLPIPGENVTDSASSTIEKLARQTGITVERIREHVRDKCHRDVDDYQVFEIAQSILQRARTYPANPERYVLAAISKSPFEVQQLIDREVA